ncbi:MAG: CapA family protein [Bacteroides sp.]|nr:CapA family protein [Bacteroides sp.]
MALSIFIAGDVVPSNRTISLFNNLESEYLFKDLIPIINSCDVSIANLEAPVIDSCPTPIKKSGPNLYTNKKALLALKKAEFNVLTLANNHFRDQGDNGVRATIRACKSCGISYVGGGENSVDARKILYLKVQDKVVALINACEHEFSIASNLYGGSNPIDCMSMYEDIRTAKSNSDFTIVILHGGIEHYQYPTLRMKKLFHHLVDWGQMLLLIIINIVSLDMNFIMVLLYFMVWETFVLTRDAKVMRCGIKAWVLYWT